jgi:hypothetical protein
MGLLIAGISIPALLHKLLPKWICILGIVLAIAGDLRLPLRSQPEAV